MVVQLGQTINSRIVFFLRRCTLCSGPNRYFAKIVMKPHGAFCLRAKENENRCDPQRLPEIYTDQTLTT